MLGQKLSSVTFRQSSLRLPGLVEWRGGRVPGIALPPLIFGPDKLKTFLIEYPSITTGTYPHFLLPTVSPPFETFYVYKQQQLFLISKEYQISGKITRIIQNAGVTVSIYLEFRRLKDHKISEEMAMYFQTKENKGNIDESYRPDLDDRKFLSVLLFRPSAVQCVVSYLFPI